MAQSGPFELLRTEIDVTSKLVASDCTIRRYGGKDKYWCDLTPAFKRAMIECRDSADQVWDATRESTCHMTVRPGTYYVGSTILVCGSNQIEFHGARLKSAVNVTAFRYPGFAECQAIGFSKPGFTMVSGLETKPFAPTTSSTVVIYGIDAGAGINVRNSKIYGYTIGIRIDAGATRPGIAASNANGWQLESVQIQSSAHAGLFVDGPDANTGRGIGIGVTGSCSNAVAIEAARLAAGLPSLGPCADVVDHEFLGSSYFGISTGYASDEHTTPKTNYSGILLGEDANSRSVCIGCYAEAWAVAGPADNHAQKNTNVYGGIARWFEGPTIRGYVHSGIESIGLEGNLAFRTGVLSGGGALTLAPIGLAAAQPVRFKLDSANNALRIDVANLNAGVVARIGLNASAIGGSGGLLLAPANTTKNVWLNNSGYVVPRQVP